MTVAAIQQTVPALEATSEVITSPIQILLIPLFLLRDRMVSLLSKHISLQPVHQEVSELIFLIPEINNFLTLIEVLAIQMKVRKKASASAVAVEV